MGLSFPQPLLVGSVGMLKVPTSSSLPAAFVLLCKLETIEDHVLCDDMAVSSRCARQ